MGAALGAGRVSGVDLAGIVQALVDRLTAGGVRAAADLRDLNPPGVLVRPPTLHGRFGKNVNADLTLWCVVPDTGVSTALGALAELMDATQTALGWVVVLARPVDVQALDGAGTLPGYELTFTQRIT